MKVWSYATVAEPYNLDTKPEKTIGLVLKKIADEISKKQGKQKWYEEVISGCNE